MYETTDLKDDKSDDSSTNDAQSHYEDNLSNLQVDKPLKKIKIPVKSKE